MNRYFEDLKKIYKEERWMLILMIFNLALSIVLFIYGVTSLNPNTAIVKTGYGDIGGYRDGSWTSMIAFPILAMVFGILHNFIAIKIYHRRGAGMTKFFLITTTILIIGTFIVLSRLLKEG